MMKTKKFIAILLFLFVSLINTANASACINFKITDGQTVLFGNSEDQTYTPISETYITFMPSGHVWYDGLVIEHGAVVVGYANGSGYSWVQGGMNDKGLAFDSTSVPYTKPNLHNERLPFLIPKIFTCGTIDEVIEYTNQHSVYSEEGAIQSFFVDKSGESVVYNIGEDGELAFFRNNGSYQLASNYYVNDRSRGEAWWNAGARERYDIAEEKLRAISIAGSLTIDSVKEVLDAIHFESAHVNTVYSNIFDVTNGDIYLYYFHQFSEVVKLNLEEELAKGRHYYRIPDLFSQAIVDRALEEYREYRRCNLYIVVFAITFLLDIVICLALAFVLGRRTIRKLKKPPSSDQTQFIERKEDQQTDNPQEEFSAKRLSLYMLLSLAWMWNWLSFPMLYTNLRRAWINRMLSQPFYANYQFFTLLAVLGPFLMVVLLSSLTHRKEIVHLFERGLSRRTTDIWWVPLAIALPAVMDGFYLLLATVNIVPQIDWFMLVVTYPLTVGILFIAVPFVEEIKMKNNSDSQPTWQSIPLKEPVVVIIFGVVWSLWFLPLYFSVDLASMYFPLLLLMSIPMILVFIFETIKALKRREYGSVSEFLPPEINPVKRFNT
jgi:hypothetical protein